MLSCSLQEKLTWKRAADILGPSVKLFVDGIEPADVKQGKLSDCWYAVRI